MRRTRSLGFTLLEVMVALSILALALTSLSGIDANSFNSSNYAKHVTVATLLARSKMIDIELLLHKDGPSDSDKDFSGDFEKEGFPNFKWAATSRKVEMDVGQLIGSLLGGDVSPDALPDKVSTLVNTLSGKGDKEAVDKMAGSDLSKVLGGGALETVFKGVGETLSKSIREVTLEIRWGDTAKATEKDSESISFVEYVINAPGGRPFWDANKMNAPVTAAQPGANGPLPAGLTKGPDNIVRDATGKTWVPCPANPLASLAGAAGLAGAAPASSGYCDSSGTPYVVPTAGGPAPLPHNPNAPARYNNPALPGARPPPAGIIPKK